MPYYCTVPRCTSMAGKAKNVSFHQFPRDEELAKLWNNILKRGKPYTKYSKVCSLHFTPEDYTITSVGKNKGQWRTLRKDAIPSQNLPSESPTPYQRKQWSTWTRDPPPNVMDPTIHQQVAQAIYMQTMLAMQAAGSTEMPTLNNGNGFVPSTTEAFAHTSTTTDTDILRGKQMNTHTKSNSYKCTECSKCFKDPDVFILHKRSHEKNEKENFNLNLTLQANPILANLLKTNTENSNIFDTNFSVESLLMTALAANMEGYMRNFTSMVKGNERGNMDQDEGDLDHDTGKLENSLQNGEEKGIINHEKGHIDHNDDDHQNNHDRGFIQDCQNTSKGALGNNLQSDRGVINFNESDINNDRTLMNRDKNIINDRIIEHFRNNSCDNNRSVRYYENDHDNSSDIVDDDRNLIDDGNDHLINDNSGIFDNGTPQMDPTMDQEESNIEYVKDMLGQDRHNDDHIRNDGDDDSQGSSDGPNCDKDLNESIDSNKLVIDETF